MKHTFIPNERLKSKQSIASLFRKGSFFVFKPIQFRYKITQVAQNKDCIVKAAFVVPKRKFKKAVDRNLLKRRITAAYRQNKYTLHEFLLANQLQVEVLFIYNSTNQTDYTAIEQAIQAFFKKISNSKIS